MAQSICGVQVAAQEHQIKRGGLDAGPQDSKCEALSCRLLVRVGVSDNSLDNVGTLTEFASAFVEVFAARRTATKHFARRDIVNRAAEIPA